MERKELVEFENYFRATEQASGEHKPEVVLLAGIGVLLAHLVRSTLPAEAPEEKPAN